MGSNKRRKRSKPARSTRAASPTVVSTPTTRSLWPRRLGLLLLVLLCLVYLDWRVMPNQSSRALPVMTLVEEGELYIDRYHDITEDKARIGGHYYSEKAPLTSALVIPFYAAVAPLVKSQHPEIRMRMVISLGALVCGTLPFLFCLLWTVRRCRAAGAGARGDLLATLSYLGTFTYGMPGSLPQSKQASPKYPLHHCLLQTEHGV